MVLVQGLLLLLVMYVLYMADRGFPLTKRMVIAFAWAIAIRMNRDFRFSKNGPSKNGGHCLGLGILI